MNRVRAIRFVPRSLLPLGAAQVIANGVREALAAAVGADVALRLFPPALPETAAWHAILHDARVYRFGGPSSEAFVILRAADAAALVAAAFGETEPVSQQLSPLECSALDRVVRMLAAQFGALCGGAPQIESVEEPEALTTFFELQLERPVRARIGVALRREPAALPAGMLTIDDLADIPIELRVTMEIGSMPGGEVAALEPGDVVPIGSRPGRATVTAAGRTLALGECGVSGERYAVEIL